ncbi:MAG: MBL fold metallo-hydrolase [Desulfobacterales bacterium]
MRVFIKWFPPSWLQIKAGSKIIYIDPAYLRTYFKNHPNKIDFSKWPDPIDGLPEDLARADIILLTHHHKDHCKKVTIDRLKKANTLILAPQRCSRELGRGIKVMEPGEELTLGAIKIKTVPAYNAENGNSTKKVHHKGHGVGYLVTIDGKTIYHAGDTDLIPEMKALGDVDVALIPIGGTYTMDVSEAVEATLSINPKVVVPMHRLKADPHKFLEKVKAKSRVEVMPLQIGETYQLATKQ